MNHDNPYQSMSDLGAEQSVLGAMLMNNDAIIDATDRLTSGDLYKPAHAIVFDTIIDQFNSGKPADAVTIAAILTDNGDINKIGGGPYLHDLLDAVPTAQNCGYYADIVAGHARRRRIDQAGIRIRQLAHNTGEAIDKVTEECDRALAEATDAATSSRRTHSDKVAAAFACLDRDSKTPVVPTGYTDLDRLIGGGLEPGRLYIPAGRPGMGKTIALTDIARHAALHQGTPVFFASIEMGAEEIIQRIASAETGTPADWWKANSEPTEEGLAKLMNAAAVIDEAPIEIDDDTVMTITKMRARARSFAARHGGKLGLIVVDYLQIMRSTGRHKDRHLEIGEHAEGLKRLARDLGCPVVAAAQLNRDTANRTDKTPYLSDLRESGSIEQSADAVILLHREDYYDESSPRAGEIDMIVAKNRSGATGTVTLSSQRHKSRFVSMAQDGHR